MPMGRPRKPPSERFGVRIPVSELERWRAAAEANEGEELAKLVRRAVRREIRRLERNRRNREAAELARSLPGISR